MSKLDLNALNELPKVDRILALAELTPNWKNWTLKAALPGRWIICPVNMYFLPALAFRRR
ncbi:phosphoadenosine phosphosulfate reductase [Escherichia coli]|uniref:Phosphoadenosine phosphosulfate reductase n=1 Tax=Escherichia coli TaxID=562 RepID=A0A2X3K6N7_ECOLX|nr:phosphoadenosine phosphosulfate reductase [Escherichia coli]